MSEAAMNIGDSMPLHKRLWYMTFGGSHAATSAESLRHHERTTPEFTIADQISDTAGKIKKLFVDTSVNAAKAGLGTAATIASVPPAAAEAGCYAMANSIIGAVTVPLQLCGKASSMVRHKAYKLLTLDWN